MVLSIEAMTASGITELLEWLPAWKHEDKALVRVETFPTYLAALDFVHRVGLAAEENNHHPDIIMNFKKVTVRYWTHKIGGVSRGDAMMARKVEEILTAMKQ